MTSSNGSPVRDFVETTPSGSTPSVQDEQPAAQTGDVGGHRVVGNIAHVSHGRSELGSLVLAAILRATGDR